MLAIDFSPTAPKKKSDTVVVLVYEGNKLSPAAEALDKQTGKLISHFLGGQKSFEGKCGNVAVLTAPEKSAVHRIVLLGFGMPAGDDANACEAAGGKLVAALDGAGSIHATLQFDSPKGKKAEGGFEDKIARLAAGMALRHYKFDKYKTEKKNEENEKQILTSVHITVDAATAIKKLFSAYAAAAAGAHFARDLMNEPPNMLYPESFAQRVKKELTPLGVEVEILDEKKLEKLGCGAALAVGQGSIRPPRIVIMRWNGAGASAKSKKKAPLAFVGKGVTFDSGGINIKPSPGMEDMKFDMGGAAAVSGAMKSLALRKAKIDVVGVIGLAENMPSHNAYRPSDIITSMSGKTIEVLNTDAEGRLVLADCLTYVQREYKPAFIVDLATLTGAMAVALGFDYCGAFVNDDDLWSKLDAAGKDTNEKLWRMPLDANYRKAMDSKIADISNVSNTGRDAGACTAAGFLERFIDDKTPWAHLDIAGVAWAKKGTSVAPAPAIGFGVRLLDRLAQGFE
jgi:leucyl aminopeptidase